MSHKTRKKLRNYILCCVGCSQGLKTSPIAWIRILAGSVGSELVFSIAKYLGHNVPG
jgi:hypothetical protein